MSKIISQYGKKAIRFLAKKAAERDANTSCPLWGYQPELPEAVKKLKKETVYKKEN
ncbi:MAG: cyclic lactone autoinducer peptide [Marvinbryantia sp.]|jgi:cyclic lactone autoinducer peptide|uniref:cyclic lactone autoinducer peptide n=1 Tax=Marvinbryantia sp. TaxID=2496532 RepID=UPI0025E47088|nr:cyclic lactone autoinducer peptide [uncultured Marvinbryantia sp.]